MPGFRPCRSFAAISMSSTARSSPPPRCRMLLDQIGWRDGASICNSQRQVLYYQRTPGGRVIFGRGCGDGRLPWRFQAELQSQPRAWPRQPARTRPRLSGARRCRGRLRLVRPDRLRARARAGLRPSDRSFQHSVRHGLQRHRHRPDADWRTDPGEPGAGAKGIAGAKAAWSALPHATACRRSRSAMLAQRFCAGPFGKSTLPRSVTKSRVR